MASEAVTELLQALIELQTRREAACEALDELADDLNTHSNRLKIAKTAMGAGGIVGSVLAITGIALTPVTFGASLGLTIAGTAVGVSAGVGGIVSQIIEKVLNSKTMTRAREQNDLYAAAKYRVFQLLDSIKKDSDLHFYVLVEDYLRLYDEPLYEEIVDVVMTADAAGDGDVGGSFFKIFITAGIAAGRIAAEAVDFATDFATVATGAAKISGIVLAAIAIPLDVYTIVKNSISIHRNTPSATVEQVRNMSRLVRDGPDDVDQEKQRQFKAKVEKMKEEQWQKEQNEQLLRQLEKENKGLKHELARMNKLANELREKAKQKNNEVVDQTKRWCGEVRRLGWETLGEMEVFGMEFDFVRNVSLKAKLFWLLTHVVLSVVLYVTELMFRGKAVWFSYFIGLGVIYDTFMFLSVIASHLCLKWVAYKATTKFGSNKLSLSRLCRLSPVPILQDLLTFGPVTLSVNCTCSFLCQLCLTGTKLFLTLSVFFQFKHMGRSFAILGSHFLLDASTRGFLLLDGPISSVAGAVGFAQYPVGDAALQTSKMELGRGVVIFIIWLVLTVNNLLEFASLSTCDVSRKMAWLGQDFQTRSDNIAQQVESNEAGVRTEV